MERGAAVRVLVRDISNFPAIWPERAVVGVACDLSQSAIPSDACDGIETIFHLASAGDASENAENSSRSAKASPERRRTPTVAHHKTTVDGTKHLLDAAAGAGVKRFIFLSSVKAMGEGIAACLDESSDAHPVTPYGKAKLEAEKLVLDAGKRHGLHVCVLRLPLVYGLDNDGTIPRMIAAIDRGRFPSLPEVGNKRSMVHVTDVVQAALLVAKKPAASGRIYLVTDGQTYSTRQLYEVISHALDRPIPTWHIPTSVLRALGRTGDLIGRLRGRTFMFNSTVLQKLLGSAWYSSRKIEEELGFRPTRYLRDGVEEMVTEYRETLQQVSAAP
jgi:nucleoside-diphosphate-sugar epimerase